MYNIFVLSEMKKLYSCAAFSTGNRNSSWKIQPNILLIDIRHLIREKENISEYGVRKHKNRLLISQMLLYQYYCPYHQR